MKTRLTTGLQLPPKCNQLRGAEPEHARRGVLDRVRRLQSRLLTPCRALSGQFPDRTTHQNRFDRTLVKKSGFPGSERLSSTSALKQTLASLPQKPATVPVV